MFSPELLSSFSWKIIACVALLMLIRRLHRAFVSRGSLLVKICTNDPDLEDPAPVVSVQLAYTLHYEPKVENDLEADPVEASL